MGTDARTFRLSLAFLAAALIASATVHAYDVVDTGVLGRKEVFWINNARMLFPGYQQLQDSGKGSSFRAVLYLWDVDSRRVIVHAEIPEAGYVCFADGFVSYGVMKDGKPHVREGVLGAELDRERVPAAGRKIERNEYTCKDTDFSRADKVRPDFLFLPLRDGDGYYGWRQKDAPDNPMFFLPPGTDSKPIALPIKAGEQRRVTYSEYMRAYVIERSELKRKDADKAPGSKAWLLFPSGKTSEIDIPDGPGLRSTWGYAPTRRGWSVSSLGSPRRSTVDPVDAGIYLVTGKAVQRLVVGHPSPPAVSPDGCKIAAIVNPMTGPGLKACV